MRSATLTAAALAPFAVACATEAGTVPNAPELTLTSGAQARDVDLDDAQVATIATILRDGIDERARVALERASDPRVRALAKRVLADDPGVEVSLMTLGPRSSVLGDQLSRDTIDATDDLASHAGAEADRRFLVDERDALSTALTLLDRRLLPTAENPRLVANLTAMRAKIVAELRDLDAIAPPR